jgi:hypothetical protein
MVPLDTHKALAAITTQLPLLSAPEGDGNVAHMIFKVKLAISELATELNKHVAERGFETSLEPLATQSVRAGNDLLRETMAKIAHKFPAAMPAIGGWNAMCSAPRDGTVVLLLLKDASGVFPGFWGELDDRVKPGWIEIDCKGADCDTYEDSYYGGWIACPVIRTYEDGLEKGGWTVEYPPNGGMRIK